MSTTPHDPHLYEPMSAAQVEDLFMEVTLEAAVLLFSAYHVSLEPSAFDYSHGGPGVSLISTIGFVGENVRGALVLGTTRDPLVRSMPIPADEVDWIVELSNQLLGRVKNKVLRRGIEFFMLPPSVLNSQQLSELTSSEEFRPWTFTTPGGTVCLWIKVVVPGPVRPNAELIDSDVPAEGDVLLF